MEQVDIDAGMSLVDGWRRAFVAKTDYRLQAKNMIFKFKKMMRKHKVDAACAPQMVEGLVKDKVLVTKWVEGTRLDRSASPNVPWL